MRWLRWLPLGWFLAGCHWFFGHAPVTDRADRGRTPEGAVDRSGENVRLDRAKTDLPGKTDQAKQPDLAKADLKKSDLAKGDLPKVDQPKLDLAKPDLGAEIVPVMLDKALFSPQSISGNGMANWNHPIGCAGAVLVVGTARIGNSTVTKVTQSGSTMTLGKSHEGVAVGTALYYSVVPQAGTAPIVVSASGPDMVVAGSASFCNANTGTLQTWTVGGAPASSSLLASAGSWPKGYAIVDVAATTGTSLAFTPAQHALGLPNQRWPRVEQPARWVVHLRLDGHELGVVVRLRRAADQVASSAVHT